MRLRPFSDGHLITMRLWSLSGKADWLIINRSARPRIGNEILNSLNYRIGPHEQTTRFYEIKIFWAILHRRWSFTNKPSDVSHSSHKERSIATRSNSLFRSHLHISITTKSSRDWNGGIPQLLKTFLGLGENDPAILSRRVRLLRTTWKRVETILVMWPVCV